MNEMAAMFREVSDFLYDIIFDEFIKQYFQPKYNVKQRKIYMLSPILLHRLLGIGNAALYNAKI